MIRLGLRLAVAGGREAVARLAIIAAAVALGMLLLLSILAAVNGFLSQGMRYRWLNSGSVAIAGQQAPQATNPVWWRLGDDLFQGRAIAVVHVAGTGPDSPVPPGIPRLPRPGEYYASPALAELLRTTPAGELADRYPGRLVGTIGSAALPSPQSLTVIIGDRPEVVSRLPGARQLRHILSPSGSDCRDCGIGLRQAGIDLVVSVVAGGLLFPVLIFIGTATRLNAARREERFAAMRLVGATPKQIAILATVESTAAALAGTGLGFGLFYLLRDQIAAIPLTGEPFFRADLRLSLAEVLGIALGAPAAAALTARLALRRVRITPLGVTRRVTPRPPRAYRLIPLAAGVAELAFFIGRRPVTANGQTMAFLPGFILIMVGLVVAGPWLTMVGSRLLAHRARRPAALIAARRLADNPRAGFRAVSGLMLAIFVTSVAVGVITTINAHRSPASVAPNSRGTLSATFWDDLRHPGLAASTADPVPAGLRALPGVRSVTVVRANPATEGAEPGLVSCVDLARISDYGRCPAGAEVAVVSPTFERGGTGPRTADVWPAAGIAADRLAGLPVLSIVVRTDGSATAVERARTLLEVAFPGPNAPSLDQEFNNTFADTLAGWRQLANVIIIASMVIAGSSLAVVVAGGISERRRPFSLLRLTGVPLGALRRVVVLESAVPLFAAALVATVAGFLAADLFLRAQMEYSLRPPGASYYLITGAGLLASLGIIASTLPMLRRITGPETARNG